MWSTSTQYHCGVGISWTYCPFRQTAGMSGILGHHLQRTQTVPCFRKRKWYTIIDSKVNFADATEASEVGDEYVASSHGGPKITSMPATFLNTQGAYLAPKLPSRFTSSSSRSKLTNTLTTTFQHIHTHNSTQIAAPPPPPHDLPTSIPTH